jgi:hypothetical protein
MHACKKGPELGSVYTQNKAMKDVLARCHKKTDVQVYTSISVLYIYCPVTANIRAIATYVPSYDQRLLSLCMCKIVAVIITGVYFSQVKNKP